jgi:hypothetical protein
MVSHHLPNNMHVVTHYDEAENPDPVIFNKVFEAFYNNFFTVILFQKGKPVFTSGSKKGRV